MPNRIMMLCCLLALSGIAFAADTYPSRPIRAIVGFVPGGATDIMARQLGHKLSESLGQQVIVDNRPGGSGIIAATLARGAPADGYTLFFGTISTLATNVATIRKLPYDPLKDYAPITLTASAPYFLVVHPSVPAASLKEFIALVRARPGQLNFASSGTGGGNHLAIEMFRAMAGLDMVHIPYKGSAQATAEVLAGQVQMAFLQPAVMLPQAKAGKLKVLAVTGRKRLASWPDAPPIAEAGVPGYEASSWQGVVVPAKTPKPVVARLHREIVKALHSPEVENRIKAEGSEIGGITPEEFGRYIAGEIAKWKKVVADARISVE